jgi:hypothetical protein
MDEGTGMKAPCEEEGGIIAQGSHDVNWIFGRKTFQVLLLMPVRLRILRDEDFLEEDHSVFRLVEPGWIL